MSESSCKVGSIPGLNSVIPNTPTHVGDANVPVLTSKYHFLTVVLAPRGTFVVAGISLPPGHFSRCRGRHLGSFLEVAPGMRRPDVVVRMRPAFAQRNDVIEVQITRLYTAGADVTPEPMLRKDHGQIYRFGLRVLLQSSPLVGAGT